MIARVPDAKSDARASVDADKENSLPEGTMISVPPSTEGHVIDVPKITQKPTIPILKGNRHERRKQMVQMRKLKRKMSKAVGVK